MFKGRRKAVGNIWGQLSGNIKGSEAGQDDSPRQKVEI